MSDSSPEKTESEDQAAGPLALRAVQIDGRDAFAFLQSQLTVDLADSPPHQALPAAWCDAKGRVLVFCLATVEKQRAFLLMPADLVPDTLRRIRMFGIGRDVAAHDAGPAQPVDPSASGALSLWMAPERALAPAPCPTPEDANVALPDSWLLADLHQRIPWVTDASTGRFLPQMLGLDVLGGLSYRKGCYPGQEVIARVHYRGRVTRETRLMRTHAATRPHPGATLTSERGDAQVLYAAPDPEGGYLLLAVTPVDEAATQTRYRLGGSECVVLDNSG